MAALPAGVAGGVKPLRVLLVTQSYHPVHGGIGEHVRNLGLALASRGHRVRVLTAGPAPPDGELPGLAVERIGRRFHVPSNGAQANLAVHPLYRREVRRALRDGFDLIHVHSPLEPFLPWAVLLEASVPCVGTFHNAGSGHWGYRLFGRALSRFAERLQVRTAVSRSAAVFAGESFPGEYLLVPNGVDLERFHPDGNRPREGPPTILFVGSLEPRKGLEVLIDAVAIAGTRLPVRPRLAVVGDGTLRRRLFRRAARAGVDLAWLGSVPPAALPARYRASDLLVAPALYGESFGIVLIEALASGLPVVASRIDGFAEVLDGCAGARLFPPGDAEALAGCLGEALRHPIEPALRAAARRHALAYAWPRLAVATEAAYREAIDGRPAAVPRLVISGSVATPVGLRRLS